MSSTPKRCFRKAATWCNGRSSSTKRRSSRLTIITGTYPGFHDALSKGRVPLICCPENDFDITVKLADIFSLNDVASVTIVTMDKPCCAELKDMVLRAVKQSRMPIPVQITNLFVDAEEVD